MRLFKIVVRMQNYLIPLKFLFDGNFFDYIYLHSFVANTFGYNGACICPRNFNFYAVLFFDFKLSIKKILKNKIFIPT